MSLLKRAFRKIETPFWWVNLAFFFLAGVLSAIVGEWWTLVTAVAMVLLSGSNLLERRVLRTLPGGGAPEISNFFKLGAYLESFGTDEKRISFLAGALIERTRERDEARLGALFLTDLLGDRTAQRDAALGQLDSNHAVYIKSCEEAGAALLEYGAEIDLLRHLVRRFRDVVSDLTDEHGQWDDVEQAKDDGEALLRETVEYAVEVTP